MSTEGDRITMPSLPSTPYRVVAPHEAERDLWAEAKVEVRRARLLRRLRLINSLLVHRKVIRAKREPLDWTDDFFDNDGGALFSVSPVALLFGFYGMLMFAHTCILIPILATARTWTEWQLFGRSQHRCAASLIMLTMLTVFGAAWICPQISDEMAMGTTVIVGFVFVVATIVALGRQEWLADGVVFEEA